MDAQDVMATIEGLEAFTGRGAGSDAERRSAIWLGERAALPGHEALIETFWCRPNWALAHLWHVGLAVAGSLVSLVSPLAGIAILALALASVTSDVLTGVSLGRWLTPERASQNVVVTPGGDETPAEERPTRLILTANYDAGRVGVAYRLRPPFAAARAALHGFAPGWLGWLWIAIAWLLVIAILRQAGHTSHVVGAVQLIPTVALVLGFALLLELATGHWSPAAGDNASGVAVVMALAAALTTTPPRNLELELVLSGAGDGGQNGLRRHLGSRRRAAPRNRPKKTRRANAVVLGIAACGGGTPHWWHSDGAYLPLRSSAPLRRIAKRIAIDEPYLGLKPHRGRGGAGAAAARIAGLPAISIGCLDARGVAPRSHQRTDVASAVDRESLNRAVQFALLIVDGIDAAVAQADARPSPTRA